MKGKIICKGSAGADTDFIQHFKDLITTTDHSDPKVRQTKKVVLITAAWRKSEFNEQHLVNSFRGIGIPGSGTADSAIQNLSIYHLFDKFKKNCPELYALYHEKQETIKRIKQFYRIKNKELINTYWQQYKLIKESYTEMGLHDMLTFQQDQDQDQAFIAKLRPREVEQLYSCRQIQDTLSNIIINDERMVKTIIEIESHFFNYSKVKRNPVYQEIRNLLHERILSANSIFIFSGHSAVLLNRLRFFGLRDTFVEALNRGTNFYTIGVGAEILCEKVILYNKEEEAGSPLDRFEFFDNGFGLVKNVQILPQDVNHIDVENKDLLTHIASRFNSHTCVCLDKRSYLFIESQVDSRHESQKQSITAVGESDYLYIFTKDGRVERKRAGESIFPGEEIRGFTNLIARRTSSELVDVLKRIYQLDKISAALDIRKITERFITNNKFPLREKLNTTFFYYDPTRTVKAVYLISSLGYGDDDYTFYQYKSTGIFYLPVEFQPCSRLEYKFLLDYGSKNYREAIDPYNSQMARSPFGVNSVMTTQDYRQSAVIDYSEKSAKGKLEEYSFKSAVLGDTRRFRVHKPAGATGPLPVAIFHDGFDYLNFSYLQNILDNMFHQKLVRPFISVLTQPGNRIEEYSCDPKYAEFLVENLIPEVKKHYDILDQPENVCTVGASLGGLFSMYLTYTYPEKFGNVVSQSGSFFMNRGGFGDIAKKHPTISKFVDAFVKYPRKSNPNIVMTCGRFEGLIYVNRIVAEALYNLGYRYHYFEYHDSHTWMGWANTMATALIHIFGDPKMTIAEHGVIVPAGMIGFHENIPRK